VKPVYFDYNATTPVDPRVVDAMLPYFTTAFGNAASVDHFYGHEAQGAVEHAREQVAELVGATASEIVFTSGATEASNLAIQGTLNRLGPEAEIVVSAIEHPAVLEPSARYAGRVRIVAVSSAGEVDPADVERLLTPQTALVSVMAANNETGVVQPINEIGQLCAEAGVLFHTDAVQAVGRIPVDVDEASVDMLSLSAHKIYGPMGMGALFVRKRGRRVKLSPIQFGGGQERSLRPGTLNVPGIVGLGKAAELVRRERKSDGRREALLREQLLASLSAIGGVDVPGSRAQSVLPQTVSVRISGVNARALMQRLRDDVAFSTGSACATTKVEPSHVLLAQGVPTDETNEFVRFSLGRFTTQDEIALAASSIAAAVRDLRQIAPTA
jgi:cysteine desulfurase